MTSKISKYLIYVLMDTSREYPINCRDFIITHTPIYIGRGIRKSRPYSHINRALNGDTKTRIRAKIRQLILDGIEVRPVILKSDLNKSEADRLEIELISFFGKIDSGGVLYNICDGGEGGDTFTNNPNKEEIRKKLISKSNPWNKGLTKSSNKILKSISDKIKLAVKNGLVLPPSRKGKLTSAETKLKQKMSKLGKKLNSVRKDCSVFKITDPTGILHTLYGSIKASHFLQSWSGVSLYKLKQNKCAGWNLVIESQKRQ